MSFICLCVQLEGQVVALLVQNMERLDEQVKEEADGIYNTLGKETYTNITMTHLSYCYFFPYKASVTCPPYAKRSEHSRKQTAEKLDILHSNIHHNLNFPVKLSNKAGDKKKI